MNDKTCKIIGKTIGTIAAIIFLLALSYGITTAIFYGVCWAFGFTFSFKTAFGLWLGMCLFNIAFNGLAKKE